MHDTYMYIHATGYVGRAWLNGCETLLPACCRESAVKSTGLTVDELKARVQVGWAGGNALSPVWFRRRITAAL